MLAACGVGNPESYWPPTFSIHSLNRDGALACRAFEGRRWERGVVLFGPTGTGKSHLLKETVVRLMTQAGVFAYLLGELELPRGDQEELLRVCDPDEVPVLALDDIGSCKPTDRVLECLMTIIELRLKRGAPVLASTNYTEKNLRLWLGPGYGERVVGRLMELGKWVPVGGPDRRREM